MILWIKAPINVGDELGRVRVILDGETLVDEPVLALTEVPEGGLFRRLWDAIKLFVQLFEEPQAQSVPWPGERRRE